MPKIIGRPTIGMTVTVELSEEEARALDALFGYNCDAFLDTFYRQMGKAYLQPHEAGFKSLHNSRGFLAAVLGRIDDARKAFYKEEK